ncbi:MAG: MscS Mechanosensitive ion channel [Chloroflexi bacterium OLB14]|nr:MAG: MscS Mechanosensitive ion channel [Chloroflexi bacterium OLB14]
MEIFSTLIDNFLQSLPKVFAAVLIVIASYYLGKILGKFLYGVLTRHRADVGVTQLLSGTIKWVFIFLGIITALQLFFDVTAFLAGLGIIGFTIGFALQNIMQNFVSGVILLVQRPFRVGHKVGIAGYEGVVLKIGLRTTEMKTNDGRIMFVPNADVLSQAIINHTRAQVRRVELPLHVAYDSDIEKVRNLILDQIKTIHGYVDEPESQVLFHTFGDSSIDLNVLFWIDTSLTSTGVAQDVAIEKIHTSFRKAKIEIPYPIQVQMTRTKKNK